MIPRNVVLAAAVGWVLFLAPSVAQVVIGGAGLPAVEVNLNALDALPPPAGAPLWRLPLPSATPVAPIQLRHPEEPALTPAPNLLPVIPRVAAPIPEPVHPPLEPASAPAAASEGDMPPAPDPGDVPPIALAPAPAPALGAEPGLAPNPAPMMGASPVANLETPGLPSDGGTLAVIQFSATAWKLDAESEDQLRRIAALVSSSERRVRLNAYAGGTTASIIAARRLSLSRALAVRSYLIEQGMRTPNIVVRALGVAGDANPAERVDIILEPI